MNKKKYILVVGIILIGIVSLIFVNNKLDNKETKLDEVKLKENKVNKNSFAIMIQKEDGSGYDIYEENTWPTEGYVFNSELSGCIDNYGSTIENSMTYDKVTNKVTINTSLTSSCYVYFDINNLIPLGEYLIDNSVSGLQKTIVTGDDLYRFSGTNENTGIDNYICLGTTEKCELGTDNMYRIIGVNPTNGEIKVIKETPWNNSTTYAWHNNMVDVTWLTSTLYTGTVSSIYDSLSFKDMIVTNHNWNVGTANNVSISTRESVIDYENNNIETANIGILSLSDYYLSYNSDRNWYDTSSGIKNWLSGYYEWTMTYFGVYGSPYRAWSVINPYTGMPHILTPCIIRPTFFLNPNVNRISGSGTSEDPFVVSVSDVVINSTLNNDEYNKTITFTSNKSGKYCVNTSGKVTNMNNCIFNGNVTENESITTSTITAEGDYYVHIKDNAGNIGISNKVTVALIAPIGQYLINNSISGLEKSKVTGDTLYRFSGTTGNTGINNYICLGTSTKCTSFSDNMYRIIGVEPDTGYVKIIKQTNYGGNINWNSSAGVTWPNSSAFSTITTWYNSLSFKNMIVSHTWGITDVSSAPTTRVNALSAETSTSTTKAYIGMLALSDYYLAYRGDQNWNSSYSNYTNNWIHISNNGNTDEAEWTMSRYNSSYAWGVSYNGSLFNGNMTYTYEFRPVFYLNSTVNRISGSGTLGDPFIVG